MQHIDDHTIELYILGSDLVKERIGEIKAHLQECHGCRSLAEQMKVFYENAENELETSKRISAEPSKAIIKRQAEIDFANETFTFPVKPTEKRYLAKILYFVYRHPVSASLGGVASVVLVMVGLFFGIKNIFNDTNPSYAQLNYSNGKIEIYNKENKLLWGIPSSDIYESTRDLYGIYKRKIFVADINSDDNNEIITTLFVGENKNGYAPLTILSSTGELIKTIPFKLPVQFRNTKYQEWLGGQEIVCEDYHEGRKEIFTVASSGRSPSIIHRLSNDGRVIGQYFHFGSGNITTINIGEKKCIAFFGQNDVGEPDSLSYPVICILDPLKIVEKSEASDSRGFGLPVSDAEMYVIRFPLSDMNYIWNSLGKISGINITTMNGVTTFMVWIIGTFADQRTASHPNFEYVFSDKFEVMEVKFNSETLKLYNQLVSQGKLTGTFDRVYLENLKNGVCYWDGKTWQKQRTMVKH